MASQEKQVTSWSPFRSLGRREPRAGLDEFADFFPFGSLARLSRLMDPFYADAPEIAALPLDLTETEEAYILTVEMPGVNKDEIAIESRDQLLTIRGEKKDQREEKGERGYRMERRYGVFARSIALPDDADVERIGAAYRDGVLRIEVQKKPETKPKTIRVEGPSQSESRSEKKSKS